MAFQPKRFSPLRRPNAETLDQVGQRLDRVQDAFKAVVDPLSTHVGGLGTGASADIGGLSDTPALALASSASAGTSDEASRSDHRHPFPSGSQLWTRQAVTTATALSGTGNLYVAITASFDGAITLPAATTANQTIIIVDEAGIGSGDSNGSSENLIHVLCSGSDTITAPGLATSRTRLLLWKRYGTITLVADGTSSWKATQRFNWHVDPRSISGLECWYDSRRGITLNSTTVSAWADISGGSVDLAQAVAADQPGYFYASNVARAMHGSHNVVSLGDTGDNLVSTATPTFNSGSLALFVAFDYDFSRTAGTEIIFQSSLAAGLGFFWSVNSSAATTSGHAYIAANNAALTSYQQMPRNTSTVMLDSMTAMAQLQAGAGFTRFKSIQATAAAAAGVNGAVTAFTQTIRVGSSVVARIGHLMAFDASLAFSDVFDLENALAEVWSRSL